jgi:hypothetical protein
MWSRDEDNLLIHTIPNTIPLQWYRISISGIISVSESDCRREIRIRNNGIISGNQVQSEIPVHLSQQYRDHYMNAVFLTQLTLDFLSMSVG